MEFTKPLMALVVLTAVMATVGARVVETTLGVGVALLLQAAAVAVIGAAARRAARVPGPRFSRRVFLAGPAHGVLLFVGGGLLYAVQAEAGVRPQVLEGRLAPGQVATAVMGMILAAVAEEFVFRGVLFRWLRASMSHAPAVALSAAIFAAYHLSPAQAVPTFYYGLVLAWSADSADSAEGFGTAIVAHVTLNVLGALLLVASGLAV